MLPNHPEQSHQRPCAHPTRAPLVRLLRLGWSCRRSGWLLLTLNGVLLALSLWTLELAGAGIDLVRAVSSHSPWRPSGLLGLLTPSTATPTRQLIGIALLILGCSAALAYLKYVTASVSARASQTLLTELRSQVYDRLQRMSFSYFDQTDTGSLINRASSDVLAVKTFIDGVLLKLISVAMTLGVFITYMVQVHATLTLACLATTPMLCLATVSFSRLVQPEYRRSSTLSDQLIQILSESFHGVQVVKGFNAEPSRAAVFLSKSEEIHDQRALIFRRDITKSRG